MFLSRQRAWNRARTLQPENSTEPNRLIQAAFSALYAKIRISAYTYIIDDTVTPELYFRALADRTRLDCVLLLLNQGELCVCELVHALAQTQPHISRHLGQLRERNIVADQRRGQWVYYRLHPDLPEWALEVLRSVGDAERHHRFQKRLATMPNRPIAACD